MVAAKGALGVGEEPLVVRYGVFGLVGGQESGCQLPARRHRVRVLGALHVLPAGEGLQAKPDCIAVVTGSMVDCRKLVPCPESVEIVGLANRSEEHTSELQSQ